MSKRLMLTGFSSSDEVKDEFYFSSIKKYGGAAVLGDQVTIVSEVTVTCWPWERSLQKGSLMKNVGRSRSHNGFCRLAEVLAWVSIAVSAGGFVGLWLAR